MFQISGFGHRLGHFKATRLSSPDRDSLQAGRQPWQDRNARTRRSWDSQPVPGVYRCAGNRWRITATGRKFIEPDERKAVDRFRQWEAQQRTDGEVKVFIGHYPGAHQALDEMQRKKKKRFSLVVKRNGTVDLRRLEEGPPLWVWMREQLTENLEHAAKITGLPDLLQFRHRPLHKRSLRLAHLRQVYRQHNDSTPASKASALTSSRSTPTASSGAAPCHWERGCLNPALN